MHTRESLLDHYNEIMLPWSLTILHYLMQRDVHLFKHATAAKTKKIGLSTKEGYTVTAAGILLSTIPINDFTSTITSRIPTVQCQEYLCVRKTHPKLLKHFSFHFKK